MLALVCDNHPVNRAVFVDSVGYDAVGEAIKLSGLLKSGAQNERVEQTEGEGNDDDDDAFEEAREDVAEDIKGPPSPSSAAEKLFSILYAYLTNDFSSPPLFTHLRHQLHSLGKLASIQTSDSAPGTPSATSSFSHTPPSPPPPPSRTSQITLLFDQRADSLRSTGGESAEYAEIVPLILELEAQLEESESELGFMVLASLRQLAASSRRSQVALSEAGVVGITLERLFPKDITGEVTSLEGEKRLVIKSLTERLLELGAGTQETRRLFKSAVTGWENSSREEKLNEEVLGMM